LQMVVAAIAVVVVDESDRGCRSRLRCVNHG
jgi:hypothetical protein